MRGRHSSLRRMLSEVNTAVAVLGVVVMLSAGVGPAAAQEGTRPGQGLDESAVRQAFSVAENWVRRGSVPETTLPVRMEGVRAVHVTLRSGGPTYGQATEAIENPVGTAAADADAADSDAAPADGSKDDEGQGKAAGESRGRDLMALVRPAVKAALREAYGKIGGAADVPAATGQLSLDIQVAGRLERLELSSLGDLPSKITMNVDGLALKDGSKWAWRFPGNNIASNTNLKGQVERLLSAADLPLVAMEKVGQEDGPALYRFDVVHVVRPAENQPVVRLHRGSRVLPAAPLGERQLASLSERLADHLMDRLRGDGSFAGTYEPTADRYKPETASELDAGWAAFALARASRVPGLDDARRDTLAKAAERAVRRLLERVAAPPAQRDDRPRRLAPTAITLLALLETPGMSAEKTERVRLVSSLKNLQRRDGLFNMASNDQTPAPLMMQGLGAAAMVALFDQRRDPGVQDRARRALEALWAHRNQELEGRHFDTTLPWLAYAELGLARLGHGTDHLEDLHRLSEGLWKRQLVTWDTPDSGEPSPDAIGGLVQPDSLMEEPTWETAPRLTAQALMLRDPERVSADERSRWLIRCGLGARFLSQLTMRRVNCYYCRSPETATGGVRLSFWNNRQPLSATAASLLAVSELRHALHRLKGTTANVNPSRGESRGE